jgi:hypothetical protein
LKKIKEYRQVKVYQPIYIYIGDETMMYEGSEVIITKKDGKYQISNMTFENKKDVTMYIYKYLSKIFIQPIYKEVNIRMMIGDILLYEDIWFLAGDEEFQNEQFFNYDFDCKFTPELRKGLKMLKHVYKYE